MRCLNHMHVQAPTGDETVVECKLDEHDEKTRHEGWMAVHWTSGHVHDETPALPPAPYTNHSPLPDAPGGP